MARCGRPRATGLVGRDWSVVQALVVLHKGPCSGTTRRWRDSSRTAMPWHALALAFAGASCRVVCSRCSLPLSATCRASNLVRVRARARVRARIRVKPWLRIRAGVRVRVRVRAELG